MLGDGAREALAAIGVTEARVSRWLGRPCHCGDRAERLNQLDRALRRGLRAGWAEARRYVEALLSRG